MIAPPRPFDSIVHCDTWAQGPASARTRREPHAAKPSSPSMIPLWIFCLTFLLSPIPVRRCHSVAAAATLLPQARDLVRIYLGHQVTGCSHHQVIRLHRRGGRPISNAGGCIGSVFFKAAELHFARVSWPLTRACHFPLRWPRFNSCSCHFVTFPCGSFYRAASAPAASAPAATTVILPTSVFSGIAGSKLQRPFLQQSDVCSARVPQRSCSTACHPHLSREVRQLCETRPCLYPASVVILDRRAFSLRSVLLARAWQLVSRAFRGMSHHSCVRQSLQPLTPILQLSRLNCVHPEQFCSFSAKLNYLGQ